MTGPCKVDIDTFLQVHAYFEAHYKQDWPGYDRFMYFVPEKPVTVDNAPDTLARVFTTAQAKAEQRPAKYSQDKEGDREYVAQLPGFGALTYVPKDGQPAFLMVIVNGEEAAGLVRLVLGTPALDVRDKKDPGFVWQPS